MSWLKSKKELNSKTMTALVYETVRVRNAEIEPILEKSGAIYDSLENQLVVMAINFEIIGWELNKGNSKESVTRVIEAGYQKFFYSLQVDANTKDSYRQIMNHAKEKADEILYVKFGQRVPKSVLIYKLILELEEIKETIIEPSIRKEFELLMDGWFQVAKSINDQYKIVDNPVDLERNKPIDFDF